MARSNSLAVVEKAEFQKGIPLSEAKAPSESQRISRLSSAQRTLRSEIKALGDGISELRAEIAELNAKIARLDMWTRVTEDDNTLAAVIAEGVGAELGKLGAELDRIEARAPVGCRWGGTWASDSYARSGELWTCRGALWLALRDTDAKPGSNPDSWRLIVKSGHVASDEPRVKTGTRYAPASNRS
jgi:outer membrane murein-binding lipoprotein Lpp